MRHKLLLPVILLMTALAAADEIRIAAAADLTYAIRDIAARFEKETGHKVDVIIGSSGNFYMQIHNGAPFDLFFSADIQYPQKLESAGLAEKGSLYQYAIGRIVLWVPNNSKLDISKGLSALLDFSCTRPLLPIPRMLLMGRRQPASSSGEDAIAGVRRRRSCWNSWRANSRDVLQRPSCRFAASDSCPISRSFSETGFPLPRTHRGGALKTFLQDYILTIKSDQCTISSSGTQKG